MIFFIFNDSRHAIAKVNNISPMPVIVINPTGTAKEHFIIPRVLKNTDSRGLIIKQLTISPIMDERIMAGINDNAVCKISCLVVKPSAFIIP